MDLQSKGLKDPLGICSRSLIFKVNLWKGVLKFWQQTDISIGENSWLACEQGEGRGGEGKRRKGKPVGIHQYFDCRSFIIYAGPSFNYSDVRSNNNSNKNMLTVAKAGTLLETRISSSMLMYETTKLVPTPEQCSFQLLVMAQSQNNVKVVPGWSAISVRHIYPVNRKDNYHQKLWNRRGWETV